MTRMGGPKFLVLDTEKTLFVLLLIVGFACAEIGATEPVTVGSTEPVTGGSTEPATGGSTEPVTGGSTEPATTPAFDPYSIDCCNDSECGQAIGRSYCDTWGKRSETRMCSNPEVLWPRKKRAVVEENSGTTTEFLFEGGFCKCVSDHEIRDGYCRVKPVECCDDSDCRMSHGRESFCGITEYGNSPCPSDDYDDDGFVFPRKKREVGENEQTTDKGLCECNEGYIYKYSMCRSLEVMKQCCRDGDCDFYFGANSVCGDPQVVDTSRVCFSPELKKRKKRGLIAPSSRDFEGECTCVDGFTLVVDRCVPTNETTTPSSTQSTTTDPGVSTTSTAVDQTSTNPDQTSTDPDQTSQNPDSSTAFTCYNLTCSGEDCSALLAAETDETNCLSATLQCFTVKRCLTNGVSYEFGCTDPCVVGSDPIPAGCYSVICNQDRLCNNATSHTDAFDCQPSSASEIMIFMNLRLLSSIVLFRRFL